MLPSANGRGWCRWCSRPLGEIPLVPATSSVKYFLGVQKAWERGGLEPPESATARQKRIADARARAIERWDRGVRTGIWREPSAGPPRLRGRPPKLDVKLLKRMITGQPRLFTVGLLAERLNVTPRTIRRALKDRPGLKRQLKKRPR